MGPPPRDVSRCRGVWVREWISASQYLGDAGVDRRATIVGAVSVDLLSVDLREHATTKVGDEVVVWGRELPVELIAERADTIGYELLCSVRTRRASSSWG